MTRVLILVLFFIAPYLPAHADNFHSSHCGQLSHPQWYACESDEDCTLTEGACGGKNTPVNTAFTNDIQECLAFMQSMIDCSTYPAKSKSNASCIQGQCQADDE